MPSRRKRHAASHTSRADACPTVLLIGPLPPPEFGVAKAKKLMLDSPVLAKRVRLVHLDTRDTRGVANMGRLDWGNSVLAVKHIYRLARMLARERPDITMLTASQGKLGLFRDAIFVRLARTFRSRVVVHLRGSRYADLRTLEGRMAAHQLRFILKSSSLVIVLGGSLVNMAKAVRPQSPVAVIPNGCPPAVSAKAVGRRDETRPLIAYIGLLGAAKGIEEALAAARRIADDVPSLEFVLCGEWESAKYNAKTQRLVEELRLADVVRFPGPTADAEKEDLFARAWALVVPSHSEGHPWVIIEAMSAGLPVVATDTGAVAETVRDGVSGFVIPVGDSAALARRIIALLTEDCLWKSMAAESVRRYQDLFTVERSHTLLADELCRVAATAPRQEERRR